MITPEVSVVISARNEELTLPGKLENLDQSDYPRARLQIVIASDGSTDRTPEILRSHATKIVPVILDRSLGKGCALNEAVKHATGEILVFLDTRQSIDPNAISELVSCFADPTVGAVSGELLLLDPDSTSGSANALGVYWKLEKLIRRTESMSGSAVGVTGAIYAIRREVYEEIPSGTILDDVYIPMHVALKGKRVIFLPSAIARDRLFGDKGKEFSRKVRTLTGNYQLIKLEPWLLSPKNPLLFRFISHKILRLLVPALLVLILVASGLARGSFYRAMFGIQVLFYVLAAYGWANPAAKKLKPVAIANTFVMLNAAAALAFYNFIVDRKAVWM
jgi:cellulose synthase/poly-beta-1,6-N-acetylglucosamine synthase-like glycosyltransferase